MDKKVRLIVAALLVGTGYYYGAMIGFALTFQPQPISIFWPPNSILLGALLLAPPRWWWLFLLSALPAHLAAEMQSGVPSTMVLAWFVSNCSEALIGAAAVRSLISGGLRFDSFRHVSLFLFLCAFLAPFLSSFLDAALVKTIGWGQGDYWQLWRLRFFSNVLAALAFVPVLLTWRMDGLASGRDASFLRRVEACLLALSLFSVSIVVFISGYDAADAPVILYAPLPILLWAAVRFPPVAFSLSFLAVTFLAIWGAVHGHGPFVSGSPPKNALSIQLFLIGVSVPLLLLSSAVQERRQTQEALRQKEEKLRLALSAARMDTWDWDIRRAKGTCSSVSKSLFGLGDGDIDISLESFALLLHPDDRKTTMATIGRVMQEGTSYEAEFRIVRPDGEVRWVMGKGAVIRDEANRPVRMVGVNLDITDQRQAEFEAQKQREQLTHLTRVAVLGKFSGALAHELNQPLTAILCNAQAAQRFLTRPVVSLAVIKEILQDIVDEDKRAAEVIRRLRALFMKGAPKLQPLDLNEVVSEVLDFAHSDLISRKVRVALHMEPRLNVVLGDRVQIQQVLLNLVINACEAMAGNTPDKRQLDLLTDAGVDGNVRIAVSDSGPGIAADAIGRLFESFFTTKVHGLGFGLSVSHSIVAEHGGSIEAVNNPEGGATFRITLPPRPDSGQPGAQS
jgi:signal transduction histidine kinase